MAGAVRAALTELTRVVDVLQSESLDGLDDHEVLAVFQGGLPGPGNAPARALGRRVKLGLSTADIAAPVTGLVR